MQNNILMLSRSMFCLMGGILSESDPWLLFALTFLLQSSSSLLSTVNSFVNILSSLGVAGILLLNRLDAEYWGTSKSESESESRDLVLFL